MAVETLNHNTATTRPASLIFRPSLPTNLSANVNERQRTSTNVNERQRTPANVSERQRTPANVSERHRTSTNVSERQRTSRALGFIVCRRCSLPFAARIMIICGGLGRVAEERPQLQWCYDPVVVALT